MFACLRNVAKYRVEIKNYYSTVENYNLSWLVLVLFAFIFMWLIDLIAFILIKIDIKFLAYDDYLNLISLTINFIFANLIIYKGLTHSDLFVDIDEEKPSKKYENSTLSKDLKLTYLDQLKNVVESEELYLVPGITLVEISKKLEIQPKYLSQVINEYLNKNFHEFINSYRIDAAKQLIQESLENQKTILEILYECGFL